MIEVVYTPKEKNHENDIIRLPKNIKQVGDVKNARKIYIEDYAINYMKEVHLNQNQNTVGVLLGMTQKSGSDRYVFIKGVFVAKNVFASESEIAFADSDWNEIYDGMAKYFPDCEIVGWFVSTTNINAALFRTLRKVHMNFFPGSEKTLFLYDYMEKNGFFYVFENNQLVKQKGYTIYYERNEEMQDYMVDQRETHRVELPEEKRAEMMSGNWYREREKMPERMADRTKNDEVQKTSGRKQAMINYCANVAMVVLILFIGMYVLGDRINLPMNPSEDETKEPMTLTNVIKVDGNVYPTLEIPSESESMSLTQQAKAQESTQETSAVVDVVAPVETTSAVLATTAVTETPPVEVESSKVEYKEHKVQKGEKLITICKKYYGDTSKLDEIMEINKIDDVDKIYVGQIIKLP